MFPFDESSEIKLKLQLFHQAPVLQAYSVASTEVTVDDFGQADEGCDEYTFVQRGVLGSLLEYLV